MKYFLTTFFTSLNIVFSLIFCAQAFARQEVLVYGSNASADVLHELACAISPYIGDDPWHITNLYNCSSRELFIPYQLWSGASWNGDKNAPCSHSVDNESIVIKPDNATARYGKGKTIIRGTKLWENPKTGEEIEVFERHRPHRNALSYYECHERGIGKVHNPRKPKGQWVRGLCQAPGGHGWIVGKRRTCIKTTIKIVNVTLDDEMRLQEISYTYWYRDKKRYRYTLEREKGAVEILSYKKKKKNKPKKDIVKEKKTS